jgi:hypothetical protein
VFRWTERKENRTTAAESRFVDDVRDVLVSESSRIVEQTTSTPGRDTTVLAATPMRTDGGTTGGIGGERSGP